MLNNRINNDTVLFRLKKLSNLIFKKNAFDIVYF